MDALDSARIIGRYAKAAQAFQHVHVGTGSYAITTEFDDGFRLLSVIGFESALDAEIYATFMRAQHNLEPEPARPHIELINGALALVPPTERRQPTGFRVVAFVEALPSAVLSQLGGGIRSDA